MRLHSLAYMRGRQKWPEEAAFLQCYTRAARIPGSRLFETIPGTVYRKNGFNLRQCQLLRESLSTLGDRVQGTPQGIFLKDPPCLPNKEAAFLSSPFSKAARILLPYTQGTLHRYNIACLFYSVISSRNLDLANTQSPNTVATSSPVEQSQYRNFTPVDLSPVCRHKHLEGLLLTDLNQYRGNTDKLYPILVDLQTLAREQKTEIAKLESQKTVNETSKILPNSSRQGPNKPKPSQEKPLVRNGEGNAVVFSLSNNR